jgi:triacylglycerol lipase
MVSLRAMLDEMVSAFGHLLRYPGGFGRDWVLADEPVVHPPVVLIPGLADNKSIFGVLRRVLTERGVPVVSFTPGPRGIDVPAAATRLGEWVERLCTTSGFDQIDLVGHSLGGLVARYYVQRLGGHRRVRTVVTIATPHGGTLAAWLLAPLPLARQLRPGSGLLRTLAESAPGITTRFVVVFSDADEVILPVRNARLDHPDLIVAPIPVTGVGHVGMPAHPRVVAALCAELAGTPQPHETRERAS